MISREQVADLQPGDVVELAGGNLRGAIVRGPVFQDRNGWLLVGPEQVVRDPDGQPSSDQRRTLTVVSRAPRLYVNHPRTEPEPGDVVREDGTDRPCIWTYEDPGDDEPWRHIFGQACKTHGMRWTRVVQMPARLLLLVNGSTGQVVP